MAAKTRSSASRSTEPLLLSACTVQANPPEPDQAVHARAVQQSRSDGGQRLGGVRPLARVRGEQEGRASTQGAATARAASPPQPAPPRAATWDRAALGRRSPAKRRTRLSAREAAHAKSAIERQRVEGLGSCEGHTGCTRSVMSVAWTEISASISRTRTELPPTQEPTNSLPPWPLRQALHTPGGTYPPTRGAQGRAYI